MSFNSSSTSVNVSLHPPVSSSSIYQFLEICYKTTAGSFSVTAFTVTNILLILPLCLLVLYLGKQRWRQRMKMSHSDFFTYHMSVIELITVIGSILICFGIYTNHSLLRKLGAYIFSINYCGQMSFEVLTCLDRYLAVVHPIAYLRLKTTRWIRVRNISSGCVWLICFAQTGLLSWATCFIFSLCALSLILIITFFCNLSVLCALIRPGPGEGGGDRKRTNQSKQRAFHTITAIMGTLLLKFVGDLLSVVMYAFLKVEENVKCGVWLSEVWFSLPSTLVLPLLFVYRAGKLPCRKTSNESQQETD